MEDNENNGKEIESVQDPEYNQSNQNSIHPSQNMNVLGKNDINVILII